jgi:hypothetical protein
MDFQAKPRRIGYGVGALAIFVISLGVAAVVYGSGLLILSLLTWILAPLGIYTIVYGLVNRRDTLYYVVWGLVIFVIALIPIVQAVMSPIVILGLLLIILPVMALLTYWRRKA